MNKNDPLSISIVLPVYNEAESIPELYQSIKTVLEDMEKDFELIMIDDGSTDDSMKLMEEIHKKDPRVKIIQFRRNFGKAAALSAGFQKARGEIVFTIDADLQDDPREIPRFLEMIESGYDLVSGWKKRRNDPLSKTLPSKLFNKVTALVTGINLHDFNCGFKAYRSEVLNDLELYGELHRYIPALAGWKGFKVGELVVEHHARKYGVSKYGFGRFTKGFFDLLTIILLTKFAKRPLHLFGTMGLIHLLLGVLALLYLTIIWVMGHVIGSRPLLVFWDFICNFWDATDFTRFNQ